MTSGRAGSRHACEPAISDVIGKAQRGGLVPPAGLDQSTAQAVDVAHRLLRRRILTGIRAEDQGVGRVADPILLLGEELGRTKIVERLHHSAVGAGAF